MGAGGVDGGERPRGLTAHADVLLALVLLGWCIGIAIQLQQAALWPLPRTGFAAAAALLALVVGWRLRKQLAGAAVVAAAAGVLAFCWADWRAELRLRDALDPSLEGLTLEVTGVIATMPESGPDGTRFLFEVESATLEGRAVALPPLLALGWYRNWHDESTLDEPRAELRAGQRWAFPLRLKRPHGSLNPGGFDHELWLFEQGVRASGYVRATPAQPPQHLQDEVAHPVQRARQWVRDRIAAQVPEPRAAGVLMALSVGDQGAIGREDWDVFRASGVAHLVSISGLHVTMFAWLAGGVCGWAWRRSAALSLRLPAVAAARGAGVLAAAGYALFSGWGVPSQRTVWMLSTTALLSGLGLRWPWLLVLLAAAAVVSAIDPWALLQVGFWLSFVAVALLMSSSPAEAATAEPAKGPRLLAAAWKAVREGLRAQAIATLGLAPLTLVCFQQLSVVGFVANLVAIPLVTLVITPLALLGVVLPPLWTLGAWFVDGLCAFLAWLVSWPGAVWTVPAAPLWAQACGLLAGAVLLLPIARRLRVLALPLALPLLWPAVPTVQAGHFELIAADVGQGTAVVVHTRSHQLVYDTGPQYSQDSDAGQRVLLPLLRLRGTEPVDLLVLSHSDLDHTGGAASLVANWPVKAMTSSLAASHALLRKGVPHTPCHAGQHWEWDGVRFEVLSPAAEALLPPPPGAKPAKPNWLSCVLRIEDAQGHRALLTGDAEVPQERVMLQAGAAGLRSDVIVVPHHGSKTSSSAAFLDAVAPRLAIVQAAYRSRFGHPAPEVVARYEQRGVTLLRSDRCGAVSWTPESWHCERETARRYWQFVE